MPSLHLPDCKVVADDNNEIPEVRAVCKRLHLEDVLINIASLHTQRETAPAIVWEHGGAPLLNQESGRSFDASSPKKRSPKSPHLRTNPHTTNPPLRNLTTIRDGRSLRT